MPLHEELLLSVLARCSPLVLLRVASIRQSLFRRINRLLFWDHYLGHDQEQLDRLFVATARLGLPFTRVWGTEFSGVRREHRSLRSGFEAACSSGSPSSRELARNIWAINWGWLTINYGHKFVPGTIDSSLPLMERLLKRIQLRAIIERGEIESSVLRELVLPIDDGPGAPHTITIWYVVYHSSNKCSMWCERGARLIRLGGPRVICCSQATSVICAVSMLMRRTHNVCSPITTTTWPTSCSVEVDLPRSRR